MFHAVFVNVGDDFIFGVFDGDLTAADFEDNVVAFERNVYFARRELNFVLFSIVGDNVVSVARRIDENIFAFAAGQRVVAVITD